MRTSVGMVAMSFEGDDDVVRKVRIWGGEDSLRAFALGIIDALDGGRSKLRSDDGTKINVSLMSPEDLAEVARTLSRRPDGGSAG